MAPHLQLGPGDQADVGLLLLLLLHPSGWMAGMRLAARNATTASLGD